MTVRLGGAAVLFLALAVLPNSGKEDAPPQASAPLGYVCFKADKPPQIDGKLDDAAWQAAPWSADFVDIEGDKKPRPTHRTRVKMLWDNDGLYIAAELTEPHLWATLTEHDSIIFQDNDFEVFLDPDGDNHFYGELELNAKNTTWDLLLTRPYKDQGHAIHSWEIKGLKTAVALDGTLNDPRDLDQGWSLEIFWPWAGLKELTAVKFPPKDGEQYRINFSRVQWDTEIAEGKYNKVKGKKEHNWVWSPQGAINMHLPERWGFLQFSSKSGGDVKYVPDPDAALKEQLVAVYYAQMAYCKKNGKYATTLGELGLKDATAKVEIETTSKGFVATAKGGKKWHITQDSRLWTDPQP